MANIKIGKPIYSEQEEFDACVKEFRTGLKLRQAGEDGREAVAAEAAKMFRGKPKKNAISKIMRHVAEIPQEDWLRLIAKYGYEEVHSRSFMRYFQKHYPHMSTASV
jgi:hypothetical protein